MAIRYDKKLNNEINRIVKNFNQKIARLEKEERMLLPNKVYVKDIKKEAKSRKELKRTLKNLQLFSMRGSENIIQFEDTKKTNYEIKLLKREITQAKRKLTTEINKLSVTPIKIFGKEQSGTFANMGDDYYLNLQAKRKALNKNITKLNKKELERLTNLTKSINASNSKNALFKYNYIKILDDMSNLFGYDKEKIKTIKEKLNSIPDDKFYKLYNEDKSISALTDYYPQTKNPESIKDDFNNLLDGMYENIDEILMAIA